jgi:hypothetical protein
VRHRHGREARRQPAAALDEAPGDGAGRAFAGATWALAVKSVRPRLVRGEKIEFQTVGFTPKPHAGRVTISHDGLDQLPMAGRTLTGDCFRIHPEIPGSRARSYTSPTRSSGSRIRRPRRSCASRAARRTQGPDRSCRPAARRAERGRGTGEAVTSQPR